jgi:hypothetical protein
MVKRSSIFWDLTPCSLLEVKLLFGVTWQIHLQGLRVNKKERRMKQKTKQCSPKRRLTFRAPHDVISQKIEFFVTFV